MAAAYLAALRALPPASHGPRIDVSFSDLRLTLTVPVQDTGVTNVAAAALRFATSPFTSPPTRPLPALCGLSGTLRAGTSTLILGNAGGGKTLLLRRLAARDPLRAGEGTVLWNGAAPPGSGAARKLAAFAPQIDIHEPLLTVRETLTFAAASCLAPLPSEASAEEAALRAALVDHVIDTLELRECEHVILGDAMKRGVSGGQKKRVTLGEALLQGARVLALDEVTSGLDSATAAGVARFLSEWARVTGGTVVTALQAPTPEILREFDDVLLLSDGHALYHGPREGLEAHLRANGFACPTFMDIADYALCVAVSPAYALSAFPAPGAQEGKAAVASREALAAAWAAAASTRPAPPSTAGGVSLALPRDATQYGRATAHGTGKHLALLVARQAKVVLRNPAVSFGRVFQFVVLGCIFGSIYYKLSLDNFVTKISLAMFACSAVSFASFAEIPAVFVGKKVAAKQMDGGFFSPSSFVLSVIVNALPAALLSTFIFATIMYWMVGYANDAGRYFFFVLALVAHEQATSALFRLFAFALPSEELCQAAAGISTGSLLIFGGFYIAYPKIPPYMWPIYYISPFSWSVRSIVNSEFTADSYLPPLYPFGPPRGDTYLAAFGFFEGQSWKWGGIAMCLGYALLLGPILSSLAVALIRVREAPGSQRITEEAFLAAAAAGAAAATSLAASSSQNRLDALAPVELAVVKVGEGSAAGTVAPAAAPPTAAAASSALPFTPATLTFSGVKYTVTLPGKAAEKKQLLAGITGVATPGTMTALMGASGAGKTTLLDVLAFRKTTGEVEGAIMVRTCWFYHSHPLRLRPCVTAPWISDPPPPLPTFFTQLNGVPATAAQFGAIAAFAEQEDTHADYCTVREAVAFSAALRLPRAVSPLGRAAFVEEVLTLLELAPIADRRTGSLSLGERKRLTIGVELAANPSILFLDEPTTGLDARAAAVVVRVLRNVAQCGRTVVATVHQPSAEVFFAFDSLLLLAPGGREAFVGTLGPRCAELVRFLEAVPGVGPLPSGVNPATWMLDALSTAGGVGDSEAAGAAAAAAAAPRGAVTAAVLAAFAASAEKTRVAEALEAARGAPALPPVSARPGFGTQVSLLLGRMMGYMWRCTAWNGLRLFTFTFLALFFGLLYLRIDDSDQAGAFSKMAVALNGILFVAIITLNTGIPNYTRLRAVFYREKAAGYYSSAAYPLALSAAELPWTAFFSLLYLSLNYFLVGFRPTGGAFFTAYLALFLGAFWYGTIAQGFIAFFPVALLANIAGGMMIQFTILCAPPPPPFFFLAPLPVKRPTRHSNRAPFCIP